MSLPSYPEYKESGFEWLGALPSHWYVRKFRHSFQESIEKIDGDVIGPMLSVSGYRGIEIKDYDDENRRRTDDELQGYRIVRPGQLVVNTMWLNYAGLGVSQHEGHVSPAYRAYSISKDFEPRFVHHMMRSGEFVKGYTKFLTGIRPNSLQMSRDDLMEFRVAEPPREEQIAIADFLDRETAKIDALIAEQEKLLAVLAEKRQATISHAVTRGLDPNAPMKDSGIPWLGEVPAHWQVRRLRFVADIETGSADTANSMEDGEYPFFVRSQTVERIDHFTHDCEAVLTAGDGAGVGKVFHHFIGKFCAHQRVYIFRNFRAVTGAFFFEYLKALFYRVVLEGTAKSTVDSLRRPMIADFPIVVPDPKEMPEIEKRIQMESSRFDQLVSEAEATIFLLKERRSALIAAAVTGQIDVRGLVEAQAT